MKFSLYHGECYGNTMVNTELFMESKLAFDYNNNSILNC